MGAIQNAINQASGAIAGAALGIKHVKETEFSSAVAADNQAIIANNQSADATIAAKEAETENKTVKKDIRQALVTKNRKEKKFNGIDIHNDPIGWAKAKTDLEAAETALSELRNKYNANIAIQQRANTMREHAIKMTEIADNKMTKYKDKWEGGSK